MMSLIYMLAPYLIYTNVPTKMIYQIIDYVKRKSTNRKIQISKLDTYSKVRYTVT